VRHARNPESRLYLHRVILQMAVTVLRSDYHHAIDLSKQMRARPWNCGHDSLARLLCDTKQGDKARDTRRHLHGIINPPARKVCYRGVTSSTIPTQSTREPDDLTDVLLPLDLV